MRMTQLRSFELRPEASPRCPVTSHFSSSKCICSHFRWKQNCSSSSSLNQWICGADFWIMTLVHNILGAHLFMCTILILIVGIALIYGLLACCDCNIIKLRKKSENITCILCKEKVTQESWEGHRSDCARENEWFIETLPKSEVRLHWF